MYNQEAYNPNKTNLISSYLLKFPKLSSRLTQQGFYRRRSSSGVLGTLVFLAAFYSVDYWFFWRVGFIWLFFIPSFFQLLIKLDQRLCHNLLDIKFGLFGSWTAAARILLVVFFLRASNATVGINYSLGNGGVYRNYTTPKCPPESALGRLTCQCSG